MGLFDSLRGNKENESLQKELPISQVDIDYITDDPDIGEYSITFNICGNYSYIVKDPSKYVSAYASKPLDASLQDAVRGMFEKYRNDGLTAMNVIERTFSLHEDLGKYITECGLTEKYSIEKSTCALSLTLPDADKLKLVELMKDKARILAAKSGDANRIEAVNIGISRMENRNADTPAAKETWKCPACAGENEGGKFCSYCGSPRP